MNPDLSKLKDIHLPPAASWWPLAPGWWMLALLLVSAVIISVVIFKRRTNNRWRVSALRQLEALRDHDLPAHNRISQLSIMMRRVAISRFPREQVAALHGTAWLEFLDQTLAPGEQQASFQSDPGRLIATAPYLEASASNLDQNQLTALFALAENWIKKLPQHLAREVNK